MVCVVRDFDAPTNHLLNVLMSKYSTIPAFLTAASCMLVLIQGTTTYSLALLFKSQSLRAEVACRARTLTKLNWEELIYFFLWGQILIPYEQAGVVL